MSRKHGYRFSEKDIRKLKGSRPQRERKQRERRPTLEDRVRGRKIAVARLLPGFGAFKRMRILAALVVVVIGAIALFSPAYLDLGIEVAPQKSGAFWWESHRTELAYDDSAGVLYVRRQVGTAYPETEQWKTVAEVIGFFDRQLLERGWTLTSTGGTDPTVPETRLLNAENIKRYYRPQDAHPGSPYVIVAVWPVGGGVDGFNVVLTTVNPSLLRRLSSGLD
jgi:hypothetical protein